MRPLKNLAEVAVIGGGLAGLSAARQAARLGKLVTLFEGSGLYGGLVATVGEVSGLPFGGEPSGQEIAIAALEECQKVGVRVIEAGVAQIGLGEQLSLTDDLGEFHQPDAVIVASGASLRRLGVPGEEEFLGRGVSRCATCDGGFYRGREVVVIGGGDSAVHEALVLARTSGQVTVVSRSPLSAQREYIDKLDARENVRFVWGSEVTAIVGENGVSGVRLRNRNDGSESELACSGVFPFIGLEPNTRFLPPTLLDADGLVRTNADFASADPRVFTVGAARANYGGHLIQAMAEGVGAAMAAARLFKPGPNEHEQGIRHAKKIVAH
ncbi:MAG: FAD-dependent oxidoreductase [Novosphingobium sp.]|nr:FAD-dependent oxidoreductase [Novosphingobium sp.]